MRDTRSYCVLKKDLILSSCRARRAFYSFRNSFQGQLLQATVNTNKRVP